MSRPSGMLFLLAAFACSTAAAEDVAPAPPPGAVVPGTVLRWSGADTTRCRMHGRSWAASGDDCYFPIDLEQAPGKVAVGRQRAGRAETAHIAVGPRSYGVQEITLPDIPQAHPSPADRRRDAHERTLLARVFQRKEGAPQFMLPLGPPARPLPEGRSFGVDRIFDGKAAAQPHTGIDYATPAGSQVLAAADGTVVLAQDLFYPGNAVFIDHGDGLVSMYFHLANIKVTAGQHIGKGERIGSVGTTGRSTGPHLFFGTRWHNARVDPKFLLDPRHMPTVDPEAAAGASTPSTRTRQRR